jgi:hypothetical protein
VHEAFIWIPLRGPEEACHTLLAAFAVQPGASSWLSLSVWLSLSSWATRSSVVNQGNPTRQSPHQIHSEEKELSEEHEASWLDGLPRGPQ